MSVVNPREVVLPVGIRMNGSVYRRVWIDEIRAVDHRNMSDKSVRSNGGKTLTMLLRRAVQGVEGLLERKSKPFELFPAQPFQQMTAVDRDFLLVQIRQISREPRLTHASNCTSCGAVNEETLLLDDLELYEWPDEKEPRFPIDLSGAEVEPLMVQGKEYREVMFRFVTGTTQEQLAALREEDQQVALFASQVVLPDGATITQNDVLGWSETSMAEILEVVGENLPGYDLRRYLTCYSCGTEFTTMLDLTRFFHSAQAKRRMEKPGGTLGRIKRTRTG